MSGTKDIRFCAARRRALENLAGVALCATICGPIFHAYATRLIRVLPAS